MPTQMIFSGAGIGGSIVTSLSGWSAAPDAAALASPTACARNTSSSVGYFVSFLPRSTMPWSVTAP